MPAVLEKKTVADFARLPEGTHVQLIDGELIMSPSPVSKHQLTVTRLCTTLHIYAEKNGAGTVIAAPIDVYLSQHEAYQPDIIFIAAANRGIIKDENIQGAPDLIIEVLSPSTAYYDLRHKKQVYEAHGVREYWIVDPHEETVEIHGLENRRFHLVAEGKKTGEVASSYLKGFSVSLTSLFHPI